MQTSNIFPEATLARKNKDKNKSDLARRIIEEYEPKTAEDMQDALRDIFGPLFESMLEAELDDHLGYENNERGPKDSDNRRNGYSKKKLKTKTGEVPIDVPRDRDASFEPAIIPKGTKDVSGIESKVLSMFARGMSQRDISSTIEEIYGFDISAETVSKITDRVLEELDTWQTRPLKPFYPFLFVDCMFVTIRRDDGPQNCAVYTILAYDIDGDKDILGLWISDSEGKHHWMQVFDEIKSRGVEDVLFISMDGVSGLEDGAKSIFPECTVQRCIVHLVRNSVKYVPNKDMKAFCASIKKVYGASSLEACLAEFEKFKEAWSSKYPGGVAVWERNFSHVEQLFDYGSAVRKVMYTTNAVESVNSSFRKVTKKGAFPSENAVKKVLYLRITELYKKWEGGHQRNWALVRNQLACDPRIAERVAKYENY